MNDRITTTRKARNAITKQSPTKIREGISTNRLSQIETSIGKASDAAVMVI
jgi:hypothetical protein